MNPKKREKNYAQSLEGSTHAFSKSPCTSNGLKIRPS